MIPDSLLNGDNATFLDAEYERWAHDPQSVDQELRDLFEGSPSTTRTGPRGSARRSCRAASSRAARWSKARRMPPSSARRRRCR
ncbi:MAG: hypothetical protein R3F61_21960 [Myxococcota bacterium]